MEPLLFGIAAISTGVLGLSAGALVTEGAVLVPIWRGLAPEQFLAWYREHAGLLLRFFGPLEIVAAALACITLGVAWYGGARPMMPLAASAVLAVSVLGAFPLYFQGTNESFASGEIAPGDVPVELGRWARWHWMRTIVAVLAFVSSTLGLAVLSGG